MNILSCYELLWTPQKAFLPVESFPPKNATNLRWIFNNDISCWILIMCGYTPPFKTPPKNSRGLFIIATPPPKKTKPFVFPIGHLGDLRGVPPCWTIELEGPEGTIWDCGASEWGMRKRIEFFCSGVLPSKASRRWFPALPNFYIGRWRLENKLKLLWSLKKTVHFGGFGGFVIVHLWWLEKWLAKHRRSNSHFDQWAVGFT